MFHRLHLNTTFDIDLKPTDLYGIISDEMKMVIFFLMLPYGARANKSDDCQRTLIAVAMLDNFLSTISSIHPSEHLLQCNSL